jgi:hypothetical protein
VKHGLQSSHYFTEEFKQAYPTAEELNTLTSKQAVVPTVPASPQKSLVAEAIGTGRMVIVDARAPLPSPRKPSGGGMKM